MSMFKRAEKRQGKLRLAIIGPSGSGKTYTALTIAARLGGESVALLDTERGSASKYAGDVADFDTAELEKFSPRDYVRAITEAGKAGYAVLVIDSLSHAWSGAGGALEMVDNAAARSQSKNKFAAWRDVTPEHNALVDAILRYPGHVIATMRAKTEWVLEEDDRGKKVPRKIGTAAVQRDGMEYEFDVVADMDWEHRFVVSKSRCPALSDAVLVKPGVEVADKLRAWLEDGVAVREPDPVAADPTPEPSSGDAPKQISQVTTAEQLEAWVKKYFVIAIGSNPRANVEAKVREVAAKVGASEDDVSQWLTEEAA